MPAEGRLVGAGAASDGVRPRDGAPTRRDPRLRWQDVTMLDRRPHVRRSLVRSEMGEPKSRAGRRTIGYGPRTADVLGEHFRSSLYRSPESLVFCHPMLGTPLDPSKVSGYMRKAIQAAGIERTIRPWHDLRHRAHARRCRGRIPPIRAGSGPSRSGADDGALRPRRAGRVPRRSREAEDRVVQAVSSRQHR